MNSLRSFIIEELICFKPEENRLINIVTKDTVALPFLAGKLMLLFLSQPAQVIMRDTIFREVFERYGASCTNNNLNQYILVLRKQLGYLGLTSEVIETVPKFGFIVPQSVTIAITESQSPPLLAASEAGDNDAWIHAEPHSADAFLTVASPTPKPCHPPRINRQSLLNIILTGIIVLMICSYYYLGEHPGVQPAPNSSPVTTHQRPTETYYIFVVFVDSAARIKQNERPRGLPFAYACNQWPDLNDVDSLLMAAGNITLPRGYSP